MYRYIIYGPGGTGSLLGGRLAQAGESVVLIGRRQHCDQIRAHGLRITNLDGTVTTVSVQAETEPVNPGRYDIIIMTVKSYDTLAAVEDLRRFYDHDSPVICLQNGVRNESIAQQFFRRIYGGLNLIGAQYLKAGQVDALGPKALAIGVYPESTDALAQQVVDAAVRAGFDASVHPDIMRAKWAKLVANLHNAVFALCNVTVAETYDSPDGCAIVQSLRSEARAVLKQAGIPHDPISEVGPPGSMPHNPVPMYGSTWMDFRRGQGKHETDYFNGEISRLGSRLGIPTPANDLILHLADHASRHRAPPGGHTLSELRRAISEAGHSHVSEGPTGSREG